MKSTPMGKRMPRQPAIIGVARELKKPRHARLLPLPMLGAPNWHTIRPCER